MPQQLKQFVENSKKQKELQIEFPETVFSDKGSEEIASFDGEIEFGKHFLFNSNVSSDESGKNDDKNGEIENIDGNTGIGDADNTDAVLDMSLHE